MLKWLGTLCGLSLFIIIQGCAPHPQQDCGFVQNSFGERVSWKSDVPVTLHLHSSIPDSFIPAIEAAAQNWNKTAGRKLLNVVTNPRIQGPPSPHQDGVNAIYFLNTWEIGKNSEQGRTSIHWFGDLIKEADVRINAQDFGFYWNNQNLTQAGNVQRAAMAPVNVEALILHELGHLLGLKHKDANNSVMATYLASGDDRTHLAATDQKSMQCEY